MTSKKTTSTQNSNNTHATYDSNPFTLSFKGFGQFIDYARGVFIISLVLGLIGSLFEFIANVASSVSESSEDKVFESSSIETVTEPSVIAITAIVIIVFIVVAVIVSIVISSIYNGFVAAGTIAASQKRRISIGQAFSEMGENLGRLIVANIIAVGRIVGGYLLLIVPGVRAQLRYTPILR